MRGGSWGGTRDIGGDLKIGEGSGGEPENRGGGGRAMKWGGTGGGWGAATPPHSLASRFPPARADLAVPRGALFRRKGRSFRFRPRPSAPPTGSPRPQPRAAHRHAAHRGDAGSRPPPPHGCGPPPKLKSSLYGTPSHSTPPLHDAPYHVGTPSIEPPPPPWDPIYGTTSIGTPTIRPPPVPLGSPPPPSWGPPMGPPHFRSPPHGAP